MFKNYFQYIQETDGTIYDFIEQLGGLDEIKNLSNQQLYNLWAMDDQAIKQIWETIAERINYDMEVFDYLWNLDLHRKEFDEEMFLKAQQLTPGYYDLPFDCYMLLENIGHKFAEINNLEV